jgi:hypothetical protein
MAGLLAGLRFNPRKWSIEMFAKFSLAAGLVLAAATLAPVGAFAVAPQSPLPSLVAVDGSFVQKAQFYGRCRAWRQECAARWGWRSPQFFRCMGRHGC